MAEMDKSKKQELWILLRPQGESPSGTQRFLDFAIDNFLYKTH
jgi:hypothetical protein